MLTEAEITLEEMKRLAEDGHLCGECGGRLTVAFVNGQDVLRCGNSLEHKTITRHDYRDEKRIGEYRMDSTALTKMTPGMMEARVAIGKFSSDLAPIERKHLAMLAINYGFDPAMGEMTIYQGRPYISIDGRYRKAQETGKLAGVNTVPATPEEYKAWKIPEEDYFFKAVVKKRENGNVDEYTGWGRVRASETHGKGFRPVESNPQRMAEKRAESQALRKAFHIDLPGISDFEDIGVDDPNIIESTAREVKEPASAQQPPEKSGDSPATPGPEEYPETLDELLRYAAQNGKSGSWVAKQANVTFAAEIPEKDYKNVYLTIKQVGNWKPYKKGA
jgi:hypothetical protein